MENIISDHKKNSFLKFGNPFDVATLKLERDRIANDFRDEGYYDLTRENIGFVLDTSYDTKKINIDVLLNNNDSSRFKVYTIQNIYVYSNYNLNNINKIGYDDTVLIKNMAFIANEQRFSPKRLTEFIFIRSGDKYSEEHFQQTQKRLINLGVFKFTTIEYSLVYRDSTTGVLDCYIYLTPSKKQSFSIDYDQNYNVSNQQDILSRNRIGSALNFTYKNKNLSKNADLFSVTVSAGLQFNTARDTNNIRQSVVQTIDAGVELSYAQNRFIVPFKIKRLSYKSNPRTIFSVGYNFQKRIDYFLLNKINAKYGFEWRSSERIRHAFNIMDVSILSFKNPQQAFLDLLQTRPSTRLSFNDGLIPASNYTLLFNGQKNSDDYRFINDIFGFEIAGNILHGIESLARRNNGDQLPYKLLGVRYFQYIKVENDLRIYFVNQDKSALIARLFVGIGIPYGNVNVLPYVRQYSVGGGNSLRAFRPNVVGPGSYSDELTIANSPNSLQLGDMKLEANLEYRFNMYKWFKGAVFADAGNVWNIRKKAELPNGEFNINRFYKEIAVGLGAGIRADFQFFVIRFDVGFPLYDPRYPEDERLVQFSKKPYNTRGYFPLNINLGIGYPF
jgi:outer membrane protein assembly factor BamA